MAYPAVNSLIQTLELFRTTYPALIQGQAADMIESLNASAEYFQKILENTNHQKHEYEKIKDLEEEMRASVQQAEDLLESNIVEIMRERYDQQKEKFKRSKWTIQDEARVLLRDLPQAIDEINAVREDLALVMESSTSTTSANAIVIGTAQDHFFEMGDSSSPSRAFTTLVEEATVGLDDALAKITNRLLGSSSEREVIPILGMGGCGKTTLAKKAQDDPSIISHFDIQVWVTISQEYHLREVLQSLVRSVVGNRFQDMSDDQLMEKAYKALKGQRYLIILDDVWSTEIWDLMARTLPDDNNGSRIILTTRLKDVAEYVNSDIPPHEMMPLSLDESWKLLCNKLFWDGVVHNCSSELEEIGKKIVGKCHGLPLAILVVAGHLSKVRMTKESWATVARNVNKVVTTYPNECLAVLAMSYYHLPIHLKPCFLHLGTFPEDHEIDAWRLIRLWVAEGILKSNKLSSLEEVAEDCLEDLASRNLIMVRRRKLNGKIKRCVMHDLLRDLSLSEAGKEKFLNVIRINRAPNFPAQNCRAPRFSLQAHFSLEKFSDSQVVRSLYIFKQPIGPRGKTADLKALRVLVSIPRHIFKYRHRLTLDSSFLRYLEVHRGNDFAESFSYLYNLQTFIFYHDKLQCEAVITLPEYIWNMKQLRYIHVQHCIHLPNPQGISSTNMEDSRSDLGLQHLQEFSRLSFASCTKEVFSCLTNLKKLRIANIIEDIRGLEGTPGSLLNLVYLKKLESLYLSLEMWELLSPLADGCSFPISLKRLTISGGRLSREDMETLAKLPNLELLKLRRVKFRQSVWKLNDKDQFKQLKFLLLVDDTEIKQWEASSVNFPNLGRLVFHQIRTLKQIPLAFAEICTLESIELYMCSRNLEESAREIQVEVASFAGNDCLHIGIYDDYHAYKRLV